MTKSTDKNHNTAGVDKLVGKHLLALMKEAASTEMCNHCVVVAITEQMLANMLLINGGDVQDIRKALDLLLHDVIRAIVSGKAVLADEVEQERLH